MPVSGNRPIVLARYLALAWCALIVYASLHPFSGWRSTGISPWGFLTAAWPRYWTGFDLGANVAWIAGTTLDNIAAWAAGTPVNRVTSAA